MENPYTTPHSQIQITPTSWYEINYSPRLPMWISAGIWIALTVLGAANSYFVEHNAPAIQSIFQTATGIFFACFGVFLMNAMANGFGENGKLRAFSSWGFFWRVTCAFFLISVPMLFVEFLLFGDGPRFSLLKGLALFTAGVLFLPVTIWLAFSNKRRAQYLWLMSLTFRF